MFSRTELMARHFFAATAWLWTMTMPTRAQDSYEIRVYGSETLEAGHTMVELHSNYTITGQRETINGVFPQWEFNLGVGFGMSQATDDLIVKLILGRRF
jgi:hypothetical protein